MKQFFYSLFLFLIPLVIICIIILIVDPYDYFGISPFKGNKDKENIAKVEDSSRRISIVRYNQNPTRNIIIGASQIAHIDAKSIPGGGWSNIANGGANIDDEINVFWQIVDDYPIDTILFSVEPYNYTISNGQNAHQMMTDAYKIIDNPLYYFVDRYVYKTTAAFILQKLKGNKTNVKSEKPNQTKDEFWETQLDLAKLNLKNNCNHTNLRNNIRKMVDYCKKNNIHIIAVIPIAHTDIYDIFQDYKNQIMLPEVIEDFGVVYDFLLVNSFTCDKSNFGDPLHAVNENSIYTNCLFSDISDSSYCKKYEK